MLVGLRNKKTYRLVLENFKKVQKHPSHLSRCYNLLIYNS